MPNARNINHPANLGLGDFGVDQDGRWWGRDYRGRIHALTSSPSTIVRVIGTGSGGRVTVPSANTSGGDGGSIKDTDDLLEGHTNKYLSAANLAATLHEAAEKTAPVDADEMGVVDSSDGYTVKRVTWANLTAALTTLLDTLYAAITHAARHRSGGADAIRLDELAAPTDVTTLDVSPAAHGLCPRLPDDDTRWLDGKGHYTAPIAGEIVPSTAGFDGVLDNGDDTVQKALETLDDHAHTAGQTGVTTTGFGGVLDNGDDTVQAALDKLDDHTHPGAPTGKVIYYGESSNGTDAYAITASPTLTAYASGVLVLLHTDVASSGACSLNVDGLGAKPIKVADYDTRTFTSPIGMILANDIILLAYEATSDHFRLLSGYQA